MRHALLAAISILLVGVLCTQVIGQDRPPRPDRHDGGPGPGSLGGADFPPEGRPRPGMPPEMMRFEVMRGYIELVDRFSRLSRDPTTSGIAAVIAAADLLKARGTEAGIEYFTKALESAKSDAVKRAIRIQLAELYRNAGQQDRALEQLTELINAAPAVASEPAGPGR